MDYQGQVEKKDNELEYELLLMTTTGIFNYNSEVYIFILKEQTPQAKVQNWDVTI